MPARPGTATLVRCAFAPGVPNTVGTPMRTTTERTASSHDAGRPDRASAHGAATQAMISATKRGADIHSASGADTVAVFMTEGLLQVEDEPRRDRARAADHHRVVGGLLLVGEHRVA